MLRVLIRIASSQGDSNEYPQRMSLWRNKAKKKINALFPETSQYFLGSVGRQKTFFGQIFLYKKSIKIIKNTLKIEEKISEVPKK